MKRVIKKLWWVAVVEVIVCGVLFGAEPGISVQEPSAELPETDCEDDRPDNVLAIVDGSEITPQQVQEVIQPLLAETEQYLVKTRRHELNLQINSRLLEQEAKRRKIDTTKLLQEEVLSKVKTPTEEEALALYTKNKARLGGEFDAFQGELIRHLGRQAESAKVKELADRLREGGKVEVSADSPDLTDVEADATRLLAVVGGERITLADVDSKLEPLIFQVKQNIYQLKKQALDDAIDTILFEQEARKRRVSVESLLKSEVTAKIGPVTEKDAKEFYAQNHSRIDADIRRPQDQARIVQYLQDLRAKEARSALAQPLRQSASLNIFLAQPEQPVYDISIAGQPSMGPADAPVTIVEFIDYECSRCADLHETLLDLIGQYDQKMRLVVRDFPLTQHAHAHTAAIAAEAAREQGRYWEYISILFMNQSALGVEQLKQYADELGLDRKRFDQVLDNETFAEQLDQDQRDGLQLGVNSTPVVFVNGQRVDDKTPESLKKAIEAALQQTQTARKDSGCRQSGTCDKKVWPLGRVG